MQTAGAATHRPRRSQGSSILLAIQAVSGSSSDHSMGSQSRSTQSGTAAAMNPAQASACTPNARR